MITIVSRACFLDSDEIDGHVAVQLDAQTVAILREYQKRLFLLRSEFPEVIKIGAVLPVRQGARGRFFRTNIPVEIAHNITVHNFHLARGDFAENGLSNLRTDNWPDLIVRLEEDDVIFDIGEDTERGDTWWPETEAIPLNWILDLVF